MIKKILLSMILTGLIVFPVSSFAQAELPFGGFSTFTTPCTCSGTFYVWFAPLYLGGPVVITGPVVYSPFSTIPYANFFTGVPAVWHLGSYIPGVQACWMASPVGCFPLPSLGIMTKVGTSRPGI